MDLLDKKYFPSERTGCTLLPGLYELTDINKTLAYLLPYFVKLSITIDDIRLRSNLNINQTLILTENSFFSIHYWDLLNYIQVLERIMRVSFNYFRDHIKAIDPLVLL